MAKSATASILQRFDNENFDYPSAHTVLRFQVVETTIIRSLAGLKKGLHSHRLSRRTPRGVHQWLK
jgi:hypothetical protein